MRRLRALALFLAAAWATVGAILPTTPGARAEEKKDSGLRKVPEGFKPLFNEKDLAGWKDADKQAESWKVQDGILNYTGKGGKNLATAKNYKDFELWVDWKIT